MRKIDATKYGDATLAQIILRDYVIGELAMILSDLNSYSSRGLALASPTLHTHIDAMRDRDALTTRSVKQAHALDVRLDSTDFHSTMTSELAQFIDRLEREQQYDATARAA